MPNRPVLDFWYEFASPYSCLSALRIEKLAEDAGVTLRWRPFLLGPIFAAQGWNTSPFALYPSKGRYMWRDTARRAHRDARHDLLDRPRFHTLHRFLERASRPPPMPRHELLPPVMRDQISIIILRQHSLK